MDSDDRNDISVLFVCSGNTCRSPMAEAIARKLLAQRGLEDTQVASAGTGAGEGLPATDEAQRAVAALGCDLSAHRSQPLRRELIERADRVYAMARHHLEAVNALVPDAPVELLDPGCDIDDPYGGSQDLYNRTAEIIRRRVEQRLATASV